MVQDGIFFKESTSGKCVKKQHSMVNFWSQRDENLLLLFLLSTNIIEDIRSRIVKLTYCVATMVFLRIFKVNFREGNHYYYVRCLLEVHGLTEDISFFLMFD